MADPTPRIVGRIGHGGKQLRNLWTFPCTTRSERSAGAHPSQKPVALLERIVKLFTRPDDLILDCFLGTGTTAVAAKSLITTPALPKLVSSVPSAL